MAITITPFFGTFVIISASLQATFAASLNSTDSLVYIEDSLESGSKLPLFYMDGNCDKILFLNTRNAIRVAPWRSHYPKASDHCVTKVESVKYPTYHLVITFKQVKMSSSGSTGVCSDSRLDMFSGSSNSTVDRISGPNGICGNRAAHQEYTTKKNWLTMQVATGGLKPRTYEYFEAVITPFHLGTCRHDEFKCKNGRCIKNDMLCNGYNNCGDDSDEKSCAALLLSVAAIAGIVVGCVIIIGIICSIVICKCCCGACGYERF